MAFEDCGNEPRLDGSYKNEQNRVFHIESGKPTSLRPSRKQAFCCFRGLAQRALLCFHSFLVDIFWDSNHCHQICAMAVNSVCQAHTSSYAPFSAPGANQQDFKCFLSLPVIAPEPCAVRDGREGGCRGAGLHAHGVNHKWALPMLTAFHIHVAS